MAKRARRMLTAEGVGAALGRLAGRLDALNKQRAQLAAEIRDAVAHGERLLRTVTGIDTGDRPKGKGGRPKGYKMSEATRAKLREAWKRRKEASHNVARAEDTKAGDAREKVRARTHRRQ